MEQITLRLSNYRLNVMSNLFVNLYVWANALGNGHYCHCWHWKQTVSVGGKSGHYDHYYGRRLTALCLYHPIYHTSSQLSPFKGLLNYFEMGFVNYGF